MSSIDVSWEIGTPVQDAELDALHTSAFGGEVSGTPWGARLQRWSLFWVTARVSGRLVGFVNVVGDGGVHAIVLDTCVSPDLQGGGLGSELVARAADEARRRGCQWLHADYSPDLAPFYEERCGLRPTAAGLLALT